MIATLAAIVGARWVVAALLVGVAVGIVIGCAITLAGAELVTA